jgi:hypothetical protein
MARSQYEPWTRYNNRDTVNNPEQTTYHRKKYKPLRYFYLDGKLHKVIHVNRPKNIVTTFCYPEGDYRQYLWTYIKKNHQKAYGVVDVCNMVGRERRHFQKLMIKGEIKKPQKAYSLKNPDRFTYYFNEEDVMEIQDYFANVHWGRKRKDGLITPGPVPNRSELRAMMNGGILHYMRAPDGSFKPIWRELEEI